MCCTTLLSGQNSSEIMEGGYKTKTVKGSHEKQLLITSQLQRSALNKHVICLPVIRRQAHADNVSMDINDVVQGIKKLI